MLKQFVEIWPVMLFLVCALIALGRILTIIESIIKRVQAVEAVVISPVDPGNRLVTVNECLRCQALCKGIRAEGLADIKATLKEHGEMLLSISERISREEGRS